MRAEAVEIRLDRFLGLHLEWRSRASIQALIRDGYVYVDVGAPDRPESERALAQERKPSRKLRDGSRVVIAIPEGLRLRLAPSFPEGLSILYEDEDALAIDKPPMLPVHPSGRHLTDTLIQRVHAHYRVETAERSARPRLAHRIDRETSGVVLIGKRPRAHSELMRQFEDREVEKEYLAIVQGSPSFDSGRIDFPIGPARKSTIGIKVACRPDGQPALTTWRVVSRHRGCTLVACQLHTGRQHQIRVHMEAIGHPLVGDKLYGYGEEYFQKQSDDALTRDDLAVLELPRQALHSHRLVFTSPSCGKRIEVVSPLAPDLAAFLSQR
jgi:23S rRNA pseudouridine1911/1915/1917 synthase